MKGTWPCLLGMLLLAFPPAVQSQFGYSISTDDTLTITNYTGSGGAVAIPTNINGMSVTGLGDYAFKEDPFGPFTLSSVTIPATITNIGEAVFDYCESLATITVDSNNPAYSSLNGVLFDKNQTTLIEYPAGPVGSYTIPGTVARIGADAFANCQGLTSITIPGSVSNIGVGAFENCYDLADLMIGAGVTTIESNAFEDCYRLVNLTLPASVTNIEEAAFEYCLDLTSIVIPDSISNIQDEAFELCSSLTSVTIPDTVTNIGVGAFGFCSSLTGIKIPASVITIGPYAFYECADLASVTIPGSVTSLGNDAFSDCYDLTSVTIPDSVVNIGAEAFSDCSTLPKVTIPGSVTNIGNDAFSYDVTLTAITVNATNSFYSSVNGVLFNKNQTALIEYPGALAGSYAIPGSVTSIGVDAFANCQNLTGVTIPGTVTNIEADAFANCESLAGVTIPGSVTSLGIGVFEECYSLAAITIPGSVPSIGADAFIDCAGLGTVTIDNGVANIESNAFTDCSVLTSVAIPASVTNIGFSAFSGCTSLAAISVAAQNGFYSSVNGVLFDKGTNILIESPGGLSGHYTIPGGVTSIQNDAFFACANLTAITIPGSVTNIGANAFIGCSSLTALTIPGSVTSIGEGAFSETEITNFYFTGNAPEVDSSVFSGGPYPAVYYLPGTTGWAEFSANTGLPAAPWNPVIQTGDGAFGVQNNQFGFDITGPTNLVVVVEAASNLDGPVWTPLETVTLTNGLFHFSEPAQTMIPSRFFGLGIP